MYSVYYGYLLHLHLLIRVLLTLWSSRPGVRGCRTSHTIHGNIRRLQIWPPPLLLCLLLLVLCEEIQCVNERLLLGMVQFLGGVILAPEVTS